MSKAMLAKKILSKIEDENEVFNQQIIKKAPEQLSTNQDTNSQQKELLSSEGQGDEDMSSHKSIQGELLDQEMLQTENSSKEDTAQISNSSESGINSQLIDQKELL